MRTIGKLLVKIMLLPVIVVIGIVTLLAKVFTNLSALVISPIIFLCAGFSIYCAVQFGFLGFLIAASVAVLGFLALFVAFLAIDMVEGINARLIGFLFS